MVFRKILISLVISLFYSPLISQSISGFVREDATGEPLAYVNVFIKDADRGSATNVEGYYVILNVPNREAEVSASIIGYAIKTSTVTVQSGQNIRLDFRLKTSVIAGEEINVTAERQRFEKIIEPSQITLNMRQIEVVPSFVEPDVFRTLQLLPGVQTLNDFSSALYVRGSTPDQNLIMLDGITVYNPFHLGGVFSTFNTDAIKEADFRSGGFPARYGGRMGSILNIINRDGNTEEFKAKANISIISSKALIEGPIPKNFGVKGSWMLSGRRTYFDKIGEAVTNYTKKRDSDNADLYPDNFFPYYFYDIEGKINLDIHNDHRLILSTFYGDDIFNLNFGDKYIWEDQYADEIYQDNTTGLFDWRWGNRTNSLTWRWILTPKLIIKTFIAESRFRFWIDMDNAQTGMNIVGNDTTEWRNEFHFDTFDIVKDKTIETEMIYLPGNGHTITAGLQHKRLLFNLGMVFEIGFLDSINQYKTIPDTAMWMVDEPIEQGLYIQDKWQITKLLSIQSGLRISRYSFHPSFYFDPRIGIKYFVNGSTSVKVNWGRFHQFMTTANPPDENFRFIDIWFAIPKDRPAPFSDHTIVGIESITTNNILFRAEGYYKSFANLISLKQGEMFQENEGEIRFDPFNEFYHTNAFAYGLELLIQKPSGKVTGWVAYTYAKTKWKTDLFDWYYPKYDRTHTVNIVGDWQWTKRTHVSATVSYSSGNPFTPIEGRIRTYQEDHYDRYPNWWPNKQYLVGEKNSERYPPYFRFDISFIRRKPYRENGFKEWYFQIINATNHLNTLMYIYDEKWNEKKQRNEGVQRLGIPMFPLIPTLGFRIVF